MFWKKKKHVDHKAIVKFIADGFEDELTDEQILENLKFSFEVDESTLEWAIELTRTGGFRAPFIDKGMTYPKSNIDNDPFLKYAIQLALEKLRTHD